MNVLSALFVEMALQIKDRDLLIQAGALDLSNTSVGRVEKSPKPKTQPKSKAAKIAIMTRGFRVHIYIYKL